MKKYILFFILICAISFQTAAQNNVILNINHKLGEVDFAMDQAAKKQLRS